MDLRSPTTILLRKAIYDNAELYMVAVIILEPLASFIFLCNVIF